MAEKVSIGYWQMRGRGQVPRLLLAYTGAIWEDIQYNAKDQWFEGDKKSLGLTFPNLPYLIEGDFTLSETDALIRYIVERSDKKELLGKTVRDRAVVNNLVGIINEMTALIGALPYDKDYQHKLFSVWTKAAEKFELLGHYKGGKEWLMPYLTVADFLLAELSYYVKKMYPESYGQFGFLQETRNSFNSIPQIKKYYEQGSSLKGPFCHPAFAVVKF